MSLKDYTAGQLRRAISIKERIEELEAELSQIAGDGVSESGPSHRTMSAAARARIAAAQRARWAKVKGEEPTGKPRRRKMSPAARAKMAAAARARWAKAKASGKSHL